ncbi:hypothetical protein IMZ48_14410 [Candidatus Bathyarchaeota archaeon]|nr:hypothetical protein [Candidatus Bathyarchaeota archaeon]
MCARCRGSCAAAAMRALPARVRHGIVPRFQVLNRTGSQLRKEKQSYALRNGPGSRLNSTHTPIGHLARPLEDRNAGVRGWIKSTPPAE